MPTRSRTAMRTGTAPVEESSEPEEPQQSASRLKFDEALSWRAGKPIALADLLRRLQALSIELRDLEQEEDDRDSFARVAKELAASNLLSHKDKGVRAWTACCLVDILRLCAPDAPFTAQQLKVGARHGRINRSSVSQDLGHFQALHYVHHSGTVRPLPCIQQSARLCRSIPCSSQEYSPADRPSIIGRIDLTLIRVMF
jgi:hypothetical protein